MLRKFRSWFERTTPDELQFKPRTINVRNKEYLLRRMTERTLTQRWPSSVEFIMIRRGIVMLSSLNCARYGIRCTSPLKMPVRWWR